MKKRLPIEQRKLNVGLGLKIRPIAETRFEGRDVFEDPVFPQNQDLDCIPPDDALIQSILENGVLQPIVIATYSDDTEELKFGRRRLWASREAYLWAESHPEIVIAAIDQGVTIEAVLERIRTIPVLNVLGADRISADLWVLIENSQRKDNPIAEAVTVMRIIQEHGLTQENGGWDKLAKTIGQPKGYVKKILGKWGKLPLEILEHVSDGTIAKGVAEGMLSLPKSDVADLIDLYKIRHGEAIQRGDSDPVGYLSEADVKAKKQIRQAGELVQAQMNFINTSDNWEFEPVSDWRDDLLFSIENELARILGLGDLELRSEIERLYFKLQARSM